jgi:hypothetical protein
MAAQRSIPVTVLVGAIAATGAAALAAGWWMNLRALEARIAESDASVKKLSVGKRIPPSRDVLAYVTTRQAATDERYRQWVSTVAAAPVAAAAGDDLQVFFQERVHEVQRTLERLAAARRQNVPEQLGLPKELPPAETVPRLLTQLALVQEAAELIFEQDVAGLASFKLEDPDIIPTDDHLRALLVRAPVRVRFSATLPQLMHVLEAMERARPLIAIRSMQLLGAAPAAGEPGASLEVELVMARHVAPSDIRDLAADGGS